MFKREVVEVESLPRPDTNAGESGADLLVFRRWWDELEGSVQILVEVFLDSLGGSRDEIDLWRGWRRGLFQILGERLNFVARLHLLHVRHVPWIKELSAEKGEGEGGRRGKDFLDPRRHLAFPTGADHEIVARIVTGGPAADIAIVIGIAVDQLHRVVAFLFHCWHRDHHRLRAQIQPDHRIRRVTIWRDDRRVFGGGDAVLVIDLVEGRLVLAGLRVHGKLIHDRVVHDKRQAVNESFLGDRLGFRDARCGHARFIVGLLRARNGVALFLATDEGGSSEGARKRQLDNALFSLFHSCSFIGEFGWIVELTIYFPGLIYQAPLATPGTTRDAGVGHRCSWHPDDIDE